MSQTPLIRRKGNHNSNGTDSHSKVKADGLIRLDHRKIELEQRAGIRGGERRTSIVAAVYPHSFDAMIRHDEMQAAGTMMTMWSAVLGGR